MFTYTIVHPVYPPPTRLILPPPQKKKTLHNHCFQFLLVITVVPREIEDNGYAIYIYIFFLGGGGGGGDKVYYRLCQNGEQSVWVPTIDILI